MASQFLYTFGGANSRKGHAATGQLLRGLLSLAVANVLLYEPVVEGSTTFASSKEYYTATVIGISYLVPSYY